MNGNIKIGQIWGIPIGLHLSWFLIFGLVTWSLAAGFFPEEYPSLTTSTYWVLGAITSILFFGSVLVHELAHAFVALRHKVPVRSISLFIFGGVAELTQEPRNARSEFWIAIAGPLASLGLAALFGGLYLLDQHIPMLAAPSIWLARINLALVVFNLIPGFPLDGGRILRAMVWWRTKDLNKATRIASFSGQLIAYGFIIIGIIVGLGVSFFDGIWLVLIGWFLQNAASSSLTHSQVQQALNNVTVSQAMKRELPKITSLTSLKQLVEDGIIQQGHRYFLVEEDGEIRGMLTLSDVLAVQEPKWPLTTVRQVMRPFDRLVKVEPTTNLLTALQLMDEAKVSQMPVIENNQVLGLLSRDSIFSYLQVRAELGV